MLKSFQLLFLLFSLSLQGWSQVWKSVDIDKGIKPVITIDNNNVVHIAYMTETDDGWIKHAIYQDSLKEINTVANGYYYGPLDLAYDRANNSLGITAHDHNTNGGEELYAYYSNNTWSVDFIESGGHDGWDNSLVYDANGTPHTSSVDQNGEIEYATIKGGNWEKIIVAEPRTMYRHATSIALDS